MKKIALAFLAVVTLSSTVAFAQDGSDRTPMAQRYAQQHNGN